MIRIKLESILRIEKCIGPKKGLFDCIKYLKIVNRVFNF